MDREVTIWIPAVVTLEKKQKYTINVETCMYMLV